jgi:TRAP-type C4-dicarboxylate transport system permease small subunit
VSLPRGPLFYLGSAGLLGATAFDAAAVLGRHIGLPFPGSLELVQASILLASTAALAAATASRRHATARLVLDRVSAPVRRIMLRINAVLTVIFFLLLAAGQIWISSDLWHAHEDTEVLHIPYAPLRLVCIAGILVAALFTARLIARPDEQ